MNKHVGYPGIKKILYPLCELCVLCVLCGFPFFPYFEVMTREFNDG